MKDARKLNPFGLRMPDEMRGRLEKSASISGRSLNAEILHRLEGSFSVGETEKRLKAVEAALRKQGLMK